MDSFILTTYLENDNNTVISEAGYPFKCISWCFGNRPEAGQLPHVSWQNAFPQLVFHFSLEWRIIDYV